MLVQARNLLTRSEGARIPMTSHHRNGRPADDRGVYGISVAAELCGVPAQSLRLWERRGLLAPARSEGGTRRYSDDDIARLGRISDLTAAGINIAGIGRILELEEDNAILRTAHIRDLNPPDGTK